MEFSVEDEDLIVYSSFDFKYLKGIATIISYTILYCDL